MIATTLDALLDAGFTYEESIYFIRGITEGRSQAPFPTSTSEATIPPVNSAPSSERSSAAWADIPGPVPEPLVTAPNDMHPNPPDAPAVQETPNFSPAPPAIQTLICGLAGEATCPQPLYDTMASLREHLHMHGHKHPGRSSVQCPWMGCQDQLQWENMSRHIGSIHMGIRLQCWRCGKLFTRATALEKHAASDKNKC
ncbi:hypothetical protein PAXINDRAFT_101072 [Paxillus involutus ATCC 200175]|uniref:Unplaced genomic scaffold PAXINscaffold_37, whole genome shotgun sequence n=1 Tax=Paxillus involutus ATCC 200175 TaxID=664439 RepID=A0A0C9TQV7_PAXIN|nr:hypothetical protein PAXINDRAFT_101072 [Paxillus involutus ATCC 200175]